MHFPNARCDFAVGASYALLAGELRYVFLFVTLNQESQDFHERGERMPFIFADFINQGIQDRYKTRIFLRGVGNVHEIRQCRPRLQGAADVAVEHALLFPCVLIILVMGEDCTDGIARIARSREGRRR